MPQPDPFHADSMRIVVADRQRTLQAEANAFRLARAARPPRPARLRRLATALGLAAVLVTYTNAPASAEPQDRGLSGDPVPTLAVGPVPLPGPEGAAAARRPRRRRGPGGHVRDRSARRARDRPAGHSRGRPARHPGVRPAGRPGDRPARHPRGRPARSYRNRPTRPPRTPRRRADCRSAPAGRRHDHLELERDAQRQLWSRVTTSPTEISVLYGVRRATVQYDSARGTYIDVQFPPLNGAVRKENLTVTLTELTPEHHHYSIVRELTVAPRFEVSVSPLVLAADLKGSCDVVGFGRPHADLDGPGRDAAPAGHQPWPGRRVRRSLAVGGDEQRPPAAHPELDRSRPGGGRRGRADPQVRADAAAAGGDSPAPDWSRGVVPYVQGVAVELRDAGGDNCSARLNYRVTYVLQRV